MKLISYIIFSFFILNCSLSFSHPVNKNHLMSYAKSSGKAYTACKKFSMDNIYIYADCVKKCGANEAIIKKVMCLFKETTVSTRIALGAVKQAIKDKCLIENIDGQLTITKCNSHQDAM